MWTIDQKKVHKSKGIDFFSKGSKYAKECGAMYFETSAKNGTNVKELFMEISKKLPKNPPQQEREAFPILPQKEETRNCC